MAELKPCQFCGEEVWLDRYQYPSGEKRWRLHGFHKDNCLTELSFYLPEHSSKKALERAWNRRDE